MGTFSDLHTVTLYYVPLSSNQTASGTFTSPTYGSPVSYVGLPIPLTQRQIVEAGVADALGYAIQTHTAVPDGALLFAPGDAGTDTATGRPAFEKRSIACSILDEQATDTLYEFKA